MSFHNGFEITDRTILLHTTLLALFVEIITNRHLFFLRETHQLSTWEYKQIEKSSVINKLIFITKNQNVQMNNISYLFTLRNKAVHYTAANSFKHYVSYP